MRTSRVLPFVLVAACSAHAQSAHFHHLHLNSTDPEGAAAFYAKTFDCQKTTFRGAPAVWAQKSWLLFNRVEKAPPAAILSPIWHFGWGAEDMKTEYARQLARGTTFGWPLTELFPNFFYAYVAGPDGAVVELNTARHHQFGHLHLLSAAPVAAGEWYMKHFGATLRSRTDKPSFIGRYQVGPNMSLMMDNVNIIIFPIEYASQQWPEEWRDRKTFESPRGRVADHVSFSVDSVPQTLSRLRAAGVKIDGSFVEGPDGIAIELVEGEAREEPGAAAWGGSHAALPLPEYTSGDECLFCHSSIIGATWPRNRHALTTRAVEGSDVNFLLGAGTHTRKVVKSGYGKFALDGDAEKFASRCAGCHTTAVDPKTRTFAAAGLDCYVCHGDVDLKHSKDTSLVLLSKKRRGDAQAVVTLCGQCHLRGGKSRSTGLPYPTNYVAGDNLLLDYDVDFKLATDESLNAGDRHVYRNFRDVMLEGSATSCLTCHRIHTASGNRHRTAPPDAGCTDCHNAAGPRKALKRYTVRSAVCEY